MSDNSPTPVSSIIRYPGKLLISIVTRGQGESLMAVVKEAGAQGGTILIGRSSVDNSLLRLLSLDDKEVDILLTLLSHTEMPPVLAALRGSARTAKMTGGFVMGLDVGKILRPTHASASLTPETESISMNTSAKHELISIIVNTGYADDVMAAARAAGAPGGTIINARGTGTEEDVKFFGLTIVPEKEFVMILTPKEKASEVLEAIQITPCLNKPGIGVVFCLDVECFVPLGKKVV
ncbi:MAG: P-II family nitrogen regulator [Desulfovibrio sp.]|jgi:nitrogen regulatory protein PII|nr:P-II family nitrogen regulator [Desulfovibrio sp.]